eukprot:7286697-Alexandrium_andersonii.AAC.1
MLCRYLEAQRRKHARGTRATPRHTVGKALRGRTQTQWSVCMVFGDRGSSLRCWCLVVLPTGVLAVDA